jgi:hypothetical protein
MFVITWENNSFEVESIREAEQIFEDLQKRFSGRPTLVTVEVSDSSNSLSIGLGAEISVLSFVKGDKAPPYLTSRGNISGDGSLEFFYGGEVSEFDLNNGVPTSVARQVMRYFLETGKLSPLLEWEED